MFIIAVNVHHDHDQITIISIIIIIILIILIITMLTSADGSQSQPSGMHWQSLHCSPDRQPSSVDENNLMMVMMGMMIMVSDELAIFALLSRSAAVL